MFTGCIEEKQELEELNKKRRRGEISAEDFRELTTKWLKEH